MIIEIFKQLVKSGRLLLVPAFFICTPGKGQTSDTLQFSPTEKVIYSPQDTLVNQKAGKDTIEHSPQKAALFSAIVPGLGQVYNKKYWKVPVIYAGLGTIAYFALTKHKDYRFYREQFFAKTDDDPLTIDQFPFAEPEQLLTVSDSYRRNRDLLIIIGTGVYVLNILDAAVDAHLFTFDVSDDLSFRAAPGILQANTTPVPALSLSVKF